MSVIHYDILRAIGAKPTGLRAPIPLYMRVRYEANPQGGLPRTVPLDLSFQQVAALILEIPDYHLLRRYVLTNMKRKNKECVRVCFLKMLSFSFTGGMFSFKILKKKKPFIVATFSN